MGYYEMPVFSAVTDFLGYANLYSQGIFVPVILLCLWVIMFSWFKRYETKTAFAGANSGTFLLSIFLAFIKFQGVPVLNPIAPVILLILTGISGMFLWKSED